MSSQKLVHSLTANAVSTQTLQVGGGLVLKGVTVVAPQSGSAVKINLAAPGVIVAPSGTLAEANLVFPSHPIDGQVMFISFTQAVAKVSFSNGKFANTSVLGPSAAAGDSITLLYQAGTTKWYKLSGGVAPSAAAAPTTIPVQSETSDPSTSEETST